MIKEVNSSQVAMKPLVLALTVAFSATLINLARAGTDAGMQIVEDYNGYVKRQFPKIPTFACVDVLGWENIAEGELRLQNIASGANDMKQTVPLGTPTIMFKIPKSAYLNYCKYVTDGFARRSIRVNKNKNSITVNQAPRHVFYALRAADKSPEAILATAAKVEALLAAEKDPKKRILEGVIMVEITATNEVYVGSMEHIAATRN